MNHAYEADEINLPQIGEAVREATDLGFYHRPADEFAQKTWGHRPTWAEVKKEEGDKR